MSESDSSEDIIDAFFNFDSKKRWTIPQGLKTRYVPTEIQKPLQTIDRDQYKGTDYTKEHVKLLSGDLSRVRQKTPETKQFTNTF